MKKIKILEYNQDTFNCPICKNDNLHIFTQMFYTHHWCNKCYNYFRIKTYQGKRWIYLLNVNERNVVNIPLSKIREDAKNNGEMKKLKLMGIKQKRKN